MQKDPALSREELLELVHHLRVRFPGKKLIIADDQLSVSGSTLEAAVDGCVAKGLARHAHQS
jgi:hypothetical protein